MEYDVKISEEYIASIFMMQSIPSEQRMKSEQQGEAIPRKWDKY
jgi:hypothetical protein